LHEVREGGEVSKDYPLHPGQTHAEPLYATVPLEHYEALQRRVNELERLLRENGIAVTPMEGL
jgi:hypothetical protein